MKGELNKNMNKGEGMKSGRVSLGGAVVFILFSVCLSGTIKAFAEEKIVARVNGVQITEQQLEGIINELLPTAFFHGNITPEKRAEFRPTAMEEIIKRELYYQEAKRLGMEIKKAELSEAVKKVKARYKSEKDFLRSLKSIGYTMETFEHDVDKNMLVIKFFEEEIIAKAKATEEYLRDYYEKNKKDFVRPEGIRLRHILIKVPPAATKEEREILKKEAEDVLAKAKSGEDFADLAYKHSMDDWRVKGGDLGLVHEGRLAPEIAEVAFKLEPGQISGLIETINGYHIMKMEEKVPASQLSFDEISDKLKRQTESRRQKELEESTLKRLKDNAKIELY